MKYPITIFITICFCLPGGYLFAQSITDYGPYKIERYTDAEGLVSSEVNGIFKDSKGFMWLSTFDGLSRFDGKKFVNYNKENGLPVSNTEIIGEDEAGQLFIRSVAEIYKFTGNEFQPFIKFYTGSRFLTAAVPIKKNEVCLAYENSLGAHLLSATASPVYIPTLTPVLQICKNAAGEIYILEKNGQVSVYREKQLMPVHHINAVQPYINEGVKLFTAPSGKIWAYGANNDHIYFLNGPHAKDSLPVPRHTTWWQWTIGSGVNIFRASDTGSISILQDKNWVEIFTNKQIKGSVFQLFEEEDNVLWIAASGGLYKVSKNIYRNIAANKPQYYFTTDTKGRYILKTDSLLFRIPGAVKNYYALLPQVLTNVYVSRNKDVWYCTESAVYHLPYGKSIQKINTRQTYEGSDVFFRFRRVTEDMNGGIWISGYHGIFYYRAGNLKYYYSREGLTENALYTMVIDKTGKLYTAGNRVFVLVNGSFKDISASLHLPYEITRLATDREGNVWVSQSSSKIIKIGPDAGGNFHASDSVILRVNNRPFLATSVAFDSKNNLWVSDYKSLYCYRYEGGRYRDNKNPLLRNELLSDNPVIYSGEGDDLPVISYPLQGNYVKTYSLSSLLEKRETPPQVYVTSVELFRKPFNWLKAGFRTDEFGVPVNPELSANQNFIKFYFSGITSGLSNDLDYRYRLKNYEEAWGPVVKNTEAEYTGLPAGEYMFEVQARGGGEDWSLVKKYPFTITPVWYLSMWAIALWIIVSISILFSVFFFRVRSLRKKTRLQQLITEEKLKALRAQINPHFLQNTFAFLAHEISGSGKGNIKVIDRLSRYLRHVLDYSDRAAMTLEEEIDFSVEYLQLQQDMLSIPFTYKIDIAEDADTFDIMIPSMLLQPLLENALKYGIAPGLINVITIKITSEKNYIKCTVSDIGRKEKAEAVPEIHKAGKGTSLTVERLNLFFTKHKRKPVFERRQNETNGTDAVIYIPLN